MFRAEFLPHSSAATPPNPMAETFLALRDIRVQYGTVTALEISSFDVHAGEVVALIGANGAGKSTLLRVMGLLQRPTSGSVRFRGERANWKDALRLRRRMASVLQEPLLLNATVYDNTALGLKLRGLSRTQIDQKLWPWLERLGISRLAGRQVRSLSGGEAQRTSLARGFILDPELLLLDEPFSALDAPTREILLRDLQEILAETGITAVMATHDLQEAALAKRIGVLSRGKLIQCATQREIFAHPASEEVAIMVGMETRIHGTVEAAVDGMCAVRFPGGSARVMGDFRSGAPVLLCIRPEHLEVKRCVEELNCVKEKVLIGGKVLRTSPSPTHYRIVIEAECGRLTALASESQSATLGLREGDDVVVGVSPVAIHVIAWQAGQRR
jgi:tungstate transport system ATP-binding protein